MPQPVKNSATVHVILPLSAVQNYHAVVHADSGREISRHDTLASAMVDQARLNKLAASVVQ